VTEIDVAGKSADTVAGEIVAKLGTAPAAGCVLVLQGLSGTGKGTTVAKLEVRR
jgi:flagellar biosynthesis GTPase FlhF